MLSTPLQKKMSCHQRQELANSANVLVNQPIQRSVRRSFGVITRSKGSVNYFHPVSELKELRESPHSKAAE